MRCSLSFCSFGISVIVLSQLLKVVTGLSSIVNEFFLTVMFFLFNDYNCLVWISLSFCDIVERGIFTSEIPHFHLKCYLDLFFFFHDFFLVVVTNLSVTYAMKINRFKVFGFCRST